MKLLKYHALCAVVLATAACDDDPAGVVTPPEPVAQIRWVNASPDVGPLDMRPIDIVSNAGLYDADVGSANVNYQPIEAGNRTIRIFNAFTSNIVWEGSHSFAEGEKYTLVVHGPTASLDVDILDDQPPSPGDGQVSVRTIVLGSGLGNLDVFVGARDEGTPADNATWTNLGYSVAGSDYSSFSTGSLRIAATAAGTTSPLLVGNRAFPAGEPPTPLATGIPGVTQGGSVLTAVFVDGGPDVVFLNDRRPD